jgi:hypothetical protein
MNKEESRLSRRSFLTTAGGVAVGLGIAQLPGTAHAAEALPTLPWGPKFYPQGGLDPAVVGKAAYCLYYKEGGCGHGSAQALIDALGDALAYEGATDNPWRLLPRGLYSYGSGGVVGWGTICGALNGAIAVMDILGVHGKLGNALVDYFCNTELPTDALVGWVPEDTSVPAPLASIATSVSYSPLCHNSVSTWAAIAGVPVADSSKKDRCAKLVGDIVAEAVALLNNYFMREITPAAWVPPASYAGCYDCHTKPDMIPSQQGKMDCLECHDVAPAHGSWRKRKGNGKG